MVNEIAELDGPSEAHTEAVDVLARRVGLVTAS
jgi:hypothetical protein